MCSTQFFAQITEQNPAEQWLKLLGFVQHVPETKTSRKESLSSSVVTWLARAARLITAPVLSLTITLLMLSFKICLGRLIQNPERD